MNLPTAPRGGVVGRLTQLPVEFPRDRRRRQPVVPFRNAAKQLISSELLLNWYKSRYSPQNPQPLRRIHSLGLLSHCRALYTATSYPIETDCELRCPVNQAIVTQQYSGVYCRACGEPISLPSRAEKALAAHQAEAAEPAAEIQPVVFNLRCKACEKENFYGAKDVTNIIGTPRSARPRPRSAGSLMRPDLKLARTANA
jgi:hypothetical protein